MPPESTIIETISPMARFPVTEDRFEHPHPLVLFLRALRRRCPRCGGGGLFPSWLRMIERCPRCGMAFAREEGFFLGAFVVNFGVVLLALAAYIGVAVALTLPDPPPGKLAALGAVLTIVVPIAFYPTSCTIWTAIALSMQPLEAHERDAATAAMRRSETESSERGTTGKKEP